MKKTKEELNNLKNEYESVMAKLRKLSEEELKQVAGGGPWNTTDMKYADIWPEYSNRK